MLLSDTEILRAIDNEEIICEPPKALYNRRYLNSKHTEGAK